MALAAALVLALTVGNRPLHAAEPETESVDAARTDFVEGTGHFQAKRWAEALKAFERSFATVPSPNTELMIARCLRELGRRADAAQTYASAATEAKARVARGEAKYAPTADAATSEGNALRAQVGTIQVHVERSTGMSLSVDKKNVALSKDGEATVLHDPGTASVSVVDAGGAEQRQTVTVLSGVTVRMDFAPSQGPPVVAAKADPVAPRPVDAVPSRTGATERWAWPAAIASGGVSVVGLGVFAGFGIASQSHYDDLVNRCSGHCTAADRADADAGKRQQTVANVGLGVAIVAAAAAAVLVVIAVRDRGRR